MKVDGGIGAGYLLRNLNSPCELSSLQETRVADVASPQLLEQVVNGEPVREDDRRPVEMSM